MFNNILKELQTKIPTTGNLTCIFEYPNLLFGINDCISSFSIKKNFVYSSKFENVCFNSGSVMCIVLLDIKLVLTLKY